MPPPIRILTFSSLFPNPAQPQHGLFVAERLRHLLATGQIGMKSSTELQQRCYATPSTDLTRARLQDAGHALEQCRFARTVVSDETDRLALFDRDVDVAQRPKVFIRNAPEVNHALFE